jgi:hypothetical protein
MDYNDNIWMNYMKKFSKDFLVLEFNKYDGFIIPCKKGMFIPYSIDNKELLFGSLGEWSTLELTSLIKSLPEECVVASLGCDHIAVIVPEEIFTKQLAVIFGYKPNLNKGGFIRAFIKD